MCLAFDKERKGKREMREVKWGEKKSVALQALMNLGRLSSRRWQSFPTAPDGTGLTCGQHIESKWGETIQNFLIHPHEFWSLRKL
jgi:hypothetical protein